MLEKYDLKKILEEVKEDESMEISSKGKVSQDKIKQMMLEKLKKRKGKR